MDTRITNIIIKPTITIPVTFVLTTEARIFCKMALTEEFTGGLVMVVVVAEDIVVVEITVVIS